MERLIAQVAGWEHGVLKDEVIDRVGLPFDDTLFTHGIPAEVDEAAATVLPAVDYPVDQISRLHARSYELGNAQKVTAVWQDQYGNHYTSLSYKGDNFSSPGITRSATAPSGFIPFGLQESDALLRIVKSSRILREHGIPTEWIVAITEPSTIPYGGELVDQQEYKKRLLEGVIGSSALEEAAEVAAAIEPMTFFVTTRCMEINDRPFDFLDDTSPELIRQRLHKIFTVYNLTHRNDPEFHELDASVDTDCQYYFTVLLPSLQGRNLARLHNIGLVHTFPIPGNVTTLGGIIDLDSIHGEPLDIDDKAITTQDMAKDAAMVFENGDWSYIAILKHIDAATGWFSAKAHETLYRMQRNFWDAYHQHNSYEFSDTERCLMFLGMNRTEHQGTLANEALGYVRELLTEHEILLAGVFEEMAALVEQHRLSLGESMDEYTQYAVYTSLESGERPKDGSEFETLLDRLTAYVNEAMEADAIINSIETLTKEGASNAFDTLVGTLGLTGGANTDMRRVLIRSLFASRTFLRPVDTT
jgi:hypothetical protein